jgi:deferrochelatase/peroxidase EfeB
MDSMITIVAPVRATDLAALDTRIDALGNPCGSPLRDALDRLDPDGGGTHFMSLHAIAGRDGEDGHLVFEFTADGDPATALKRIGAAIGAELLPVFATARDWRDNVGLVAYLDRHRIKVGAGYFDPPGLCFAGTPRMSVKRIRDEADLARFVAPLVDDGRADLRAIDRLAEVRRKVADSPFKWALGPPQPPGREGREPKPAWLIPALAWPFVKAYLWPFGIILVALFALAMMLGLAWFKAALVALGLTFVLILATALYFYAGLRRQEKNDWVDGRAPNLATLVEIGKRENFCAQNHMISVTERKPGAVRWLTLRLVFWLYAMFATRVYREGSLGGISTIHAARWITIPGTRKLVFFSNYGGSWESYLEDFITRAHAGLTAVWSNSVGFPRASNLFQDGATDGERFKRYARASMQPTRFWYSAYPSLTTDHVRCNAAMRRGLAAALTNDEAVQWLALFGSAPRPEAKLETSQIQSLVFGGLGFMPHGACLLYRLPDDKAKARAFMGAINEHIAFGDGRKLRRWAVLTVALGAGALPKLGLPDACVSGFPAAYLEGMSTEARARILGDLGEDGPDHWQWADSRYDLALLAYGVTESATRRLEAVVVAHGDANGLEAPHRIALTPAKKPAIEPFGFVDGVSQPVIRGSYQSYRKNDPIHLVEPGEFVIGYKDNRGHFPPEPELSALADPNNVLPVAGTSQAFGNSIVDAPRAIGRNGTYLVIRQLEQDVGAFNAYCEEEAERIEARLPIPYEVTKEFIAAKLVGRWHDGSSLVRNPYYPYKEERKKEAERQAARPKAEAADEPPKPGAAAAEAARPETIAAPASAEPTTARPPTKPADHQEIPTPVEPSTRGDNDFLFGVEDPEARRCPFGAHIRRANPRDSLMPGSMEQVSISNRHRIYRLGRLYHPAPGGKNGLLFMCINGDIERQFEFIQQTWLVSPAFHGLTGEQDPLNSNGGAGSTGYLVPSHDGPVRLKPLPRFVKTLGGGYFFMPGRALVTYLGGL